MSDCETEFDFNKLNAMCEQIQNMEKFNQVEILKILLKNKVVVNENQYGIHVNLSELNDDTLNDILLYVKYVNTQESYLNNAEKQKEEYKSIFFLKDNKDINA
jgi:hypothetical protein